MKTSSTDEKDQENNSKPDKFLNDPQTKDKTLSAKQQHNNSMEQKTATIDKQATPEAQNKREDVHTMNLFPTETRDLLRGFSGNLLPPRKTGKTKTNHPIQ